MGITFPISFLWKKLWYSWEMCVAYCYCSWLKIKGTSLTHATINVRHKRDCWSTTRILILWGLVRESCGPRGRPIVLIIFNLHLSIIVLKRRNIEQVLYHSISFYCKFWIYPTTKPTMLVNWTLCWQIGFVSSIILYEWVSSYISSSSTIL